MSDRDSVSEALARALHGDVPPLRQVGISIRVPRWRRRLQSRFMPRRFKLWAQAEMLRQLEDTL